jgi:hypothetical protein
MAATNRIITSAIDTSRKLASSVCMVSMQTKPSRISAAPT